MKRNNIGNEVIVALLTIGMLALAFTFGVVLTVSKITGTETAQTATQGTPISILNVTTPGIRTVPLTAIVALPTRKPTVTTPVSATTQTATLTYTPSVTPSRIATTAQPSILTATTTATTTPTYTASPTATATLTYTTTITPTATATVTPTSTYTATSTPSVTETSTATLTAMASLTSTPTYTATACLGLSGWVPYTIRQGDTLSRISQQSGINLATLLHANCLTASTIIYPGQVVFVPHLISGSSCDQITLPNLRRYHLLVRCVNGIIQVTTIFP